MNEDSIYTKQAGEEARETPPKTRRKRPKDAPQSVDDMKPNQDTGDAVERVKQALKDDQREYLRNYMRKWREGHREQEREVTLARMRREAIESIESVEDMGDGLSFVRCKDGFSFYFKQGSIFIPEDEPATTTHVIMP